MLPLLQRRWQRGAVDAACTGKGEPPDTRRFSLLRTLKDKTPLGSAADPLGDGQLPPLATVTAVDTVLRSTTPGGAPAAAAVDGISRPETQAGLPTGRLEHDCRNEDQQTSHYPAGNCRTERPRAKAGRCRCPTIRRRVASDAPTRRIHGASHAVTSRGRCGKAHDSSTRRRCLGSG